MATTAFGAINSVTQIYTGAQADAQFFAQSAIIPPSKGGTGIANNAASTLTISGNFAITFIVSNTTGVTLPTSGTLYGTQANSFTSAQLASSVSDETGNGSLVFSDSPIFTTKILAPIVYGSLASAGNLTISSTIHATKGFTYIGASTLFAFDETNGFLGIGTSAPASGIETSSNGTSASIFASKYTSDAVSVGFVARRARGTMSSPSALIADDRIGSFTGRPYTTAGSFTGAATAAMFIVAAENQSGTNQGSYFRWDTTKIGTTTISEVMRLTDNGRLMIGTTIGSQAFLALGAGTTLMASMVLTPGILTIANIGGAIEFDGNLLFFTPNLVRRKLQIYDFFILPSNTTSQSTTLVETGLTMAISANTTYTFQAQISTNVGSTATSISFAVNFTGIGTVEAGIEGTLATATTRSGRLSGSLNNSQTNTSATFNTTASADGVMTIQGSIVVGATGGNLTIQFKGAGTILTNMTIFSGSTLKIYKET